MSSPFVNPVFNIFENQIVDDSIQQYEYIRYATVNGLDVTNYTGPVHKIESRDMDAYLLPQKGYLDLVFRITKDDNANISNNNNVATELHQNVMALIQKASYFINSVGIDEVQYPALTVSIRNLLDYSQDYLDKQGGLQWFYSDAAGTVHANGISQNGAFDAASDRSTRLQVSGASTAKRVRVLVPLERIFGFLSDYSPCMRGLQHTFEFQKQSNINHAIFGNNATPPTKIIFDEMSIWMPKVLPSPAAEQFFLSQIKNNSSTEISYDSWNGYRQVQIGGTQQLNWQIDSTSKRPKYVFVAFQTSTRLDTYAAAANPGVFDNLLVKTIELQLGADHFPYEQYRLDFSAATAAKAGEYNRAFKDWLRISGKDMELDNGSIVSYFDYANTYPIFAFDLSNNHSLFENVQNNYMLLNVTFDANTPATYYSNAVIAWEKSIKLSSTGDSITIIRS